MYAVDLEGFSDCLMKSKVPMSAVQGAITDLVDRSKGISKATLKAGVKRALMAHAADSGSGDMADFSAAFKNLFSHLDRYEYEFLLHRCPFKGINIKDFFMLPIKN